MVRPAQPTWVPEGVVMKRIAALFLILAGTLTGLPAHAQIGCNQTLVYDAATNGSTELLVGVATKQIYICGFSLWAGGTATVKLVKGTGTACATNEVAITPAYSLVTQTGFTDSSPVWRGLRVEGASNLCIKTSAGVAVQAQVYYAQR